MARDGGSQTAEFVALVVAFGVLMMMVAALGRSVSAHQDVVSAARAAARSASLTTNPADARAAAQRAADAALGSRCKQVDVDPLVSSFTPGGSVTVTVSCTVSLRDLTVAGVPGQTTLSAAATVPLELYRVFGS